MQLVDIPLTAEQDLVVKDLGPLSWVLEELRKSFDGSVKLLKQFVRESDVSQSDLSTVDVNTLRAARQHLHLAGGALTLLEYEEGVSIVSAMESAVNRFSQKPALATEDAVRKLEFASFAIMEYLESLLAGKPVSSIGLFLPYRDIKLLAGVERTHPADLWIRKPFAWLDPKMPSIRTLTYEPSVRSAIDAALLKMMLSSDVEAAKELNHISLGLAESQTNHKAGVFWKICAAFFEALAQKLIPVDIYAKRSAAGIVLHYNNLRHGDWVFSDKFMHNLLFFCYQAKIESQTLSPCLSVIKKTWALASHKPINYEISHFGHFDPALLALSKKRITVAKELWTSLCGGDIQKIRSTSEQFKLVSESLTKLYPSSRSLALALTNASNMVVMTKQPPSPELGMEVATAILYLEAVFEGWGSSDTEMEVRATKLAERLDRVRAGGKAETVEPWIEELYRRVSDRESMGSVVGELRVCLTDVEKSIDQYFRAPEQTSVLHDVPNKLGQMRGIFSVLGLDEAVSAVGDMRARVSEFELPRFNFEQARTSGNIDKFGNNLGALGFLIDMLNYQPALVKKLFAYDSKNGILNPLMGRVAKQVDKFVPESAMETIRPAEVAPLPIVAIEPVKLDAAKTETVATAHAPVIEDRPVAIQPEVQALVPQPVVSSSPIPPTPVAIAVAAVAVTPAIVAAIPTPAISEPQEEQKSVSTKDAQQLADELELRGIFLEEASEVVVTGLSAANALLKNPENLEQQSTLRRAFHTLKGSARMVELDEFGEAGWAFEQLVNTKLADQTPFGADFCNLSIAALQSFESWAQDIQADKESKWSSKPFKFCADAMRIENRFDVTGLVSKETKNETPAIEQLSIASSVPESEDDISLQSLEAFELAELSGATPEPNVSNNSPSLKLEESAFIEKDIAIKKIAETELTNSLKPLEKNADALGVVAKAIVVSNAVSVPAKIIAHHSEALITKSENAEPKVSAKEVAHSEPVINDQAKLSLIANTQNEEQFKVIGSLKIGIPLFNVYLNEADEWSRCLVTELDEWAMELHRPLQSTTVHFAHSLAGSSSTVGFRQLSSLAKHLELALDSAHRNAHGTIEQAHIFARAAEECRRLLHQFAAGFLEEPKASIIKELEALNLTDSSPAVSLAAVPKPLQVVAPVTHKEITSDAKIATKSVVPVVPVALVAPVVAFSASSSKQLKTVSSNVISSSITSDGKQGKYVANDNLGANKQVDNDDDIELVDSLDEDLFHIFAEEAQELLPKLGGSLRLWIAEPSNLSARSEILRTLHTLKGSSRLAGAMRLGELSHRMESEIESLGYEDLNTDMLEPLATRLDVLQHNFDALNKNPDDVYIPSAHLQEKIAQPKFVETKVKVEKKPEPIKASPSDSVGAFSGKQSAVKPPETSILKSDKRESRQSVRVRARLLDRLVNQAGEVMLTRTRIESELGQLRGSLGDLTGNLDRLRQQLRDVEFQAETQMQSRMEQAKDSQKGFDPLEFDRFTRVQELTRMMAESVNDVATVQRSLQRTVDSTEDDLVAQARQTRDLQRDLLRTRMEEFESISDRLYRVVRQASKEADKQVKLDIIGGSIEIDRGVLERMTPSFEHLLRNCVAHGLELGEKRLAMGKDAVGAIAISLLQDGNDVVIEFSDDGVGLNYQSIREQAIKQKIITKNDKLTDAETINLIFAAGLSTATKVTELSGRGIGLDVVRSEIIALGGRIDVSSEPNKGTKFKLVLPLTTAVTQVVMMRSGSLSFGVPSHLVEVVRRSPLIEVEDAYKNGYWGKSDEGIRFYWSGALLQASQRSSEPLAKTNPVVIFRSAGQRVAVHVDEIFGNKEVVIKNLGSQLSRLPGLAGMAILVSGAVALIYNPVALATVYGESVQQYSPSRADIVNQSGRGAPLVEAAAQETPLILVVDDSITVRRVTQRMLQREGFRVVLAVDGLNAIEKLNIEIPAVVLSDIEMPRMDGFDLVRNIRADAKLKHLPIVMITSRIAEKHRDLAMELGVNDYLGKPYSEEALLTILRLHTKQKQLTT
jgi:chemosensory pili system protein ChpA (sensor histidine kinase/response regulator)